MRRNMLFYKTHRRGVWLGLVAGSLLVAGVTHTTEVDATTPALDAATRASGEEATTADPGAGDSGSGSNPDAGLPEADDAGFGDGGEAMPGAGETEPPEEPVPESQGES